MRWELPRLNEVALGCYGTGWLPAAWEFSLPSHFTPHPLPTSPQPSVSVHLCLLSWGFQLGVSRPRHGEESCEPAGGRDDEAHASLMVLDVEMHRAEMWAGSPKRLR